MDTEDLPSTTFTIPYSQPIHAALTALINDKLMPKTRATLYKVTKQYGRIDAELAKKLKQEMEHAKVMSKKYQLQKHSKLTDEQVLQAVYTLPSLHPFFPPPEDATAKPIPPKPKALVLAKELAQLVEKFSGSTSKSPKAIPKRPIRPPKPATVIPSPVESGEDEPEAPSMYFSGGESSDDQETGAPSKSKRRTGLMYSSGEESEDEHDSRSKPKNRPGQRARQAQWEQKFGAEANHIRKGQQDPNATKKTLQVRKRVKVEKPIPGMPRPPQVKKKVDEVVTHPRGANETVKEGTRPSVKTSVKIGATQDLHPSWAAKLAQREKAALVASIKPTKIIFD